MGKFDCEKYWDFRVWVKSQIAQLRALLSEYQQNGGGGGTGGGGDFDPNGTYPNVTVGNATKAVSATTANTANRATTADRATHADSATTATTADKATTADTATSADKATTADYATTAGQATTADSAKTATNADRATTAGYATTAGVAESTEHATTASVATRATVADKATTADSATDLSGRVEATPEVFTYRPSAGDKSIKDDNAFIRRVKGNSVVWNAMISSISRRDNFEGVTTYYDQTTNEYVIENISRSSNYSSGSNRLQIQPLTNFISGHKYILLSDKNITGVGVYDQNTPNSFQNVNTIFSPTNNGAIYARIDRTFNFATHCPVGATLRLKIQLIDLTTMFGTGNEPTTVDEFHAFYPNSYYPYNTGEIRNLACSGIKTVGFNLVDKNYFLTGVISGSDTPSQNSNYRYIKVPVFPNTEYYLKDVSNLYYYNSYILYDSNMNRIKASGKVVTGDKPYNVSFVITTPSNAAYMIVNVHKDFVDTCCINLHHTGYRDGEYEPYKEVTHALPLSQITNGEPLRKAGSVYDEINETEYIRRVGVRGYATGDKDDATLITDGRYTNYPLDEPIVTPIETPIDFNYYVEDFGTEEAILAENSAPFSADIIYQFNATDQVRNNSRNIQRLQKSVFTPSGSTSQYIRGDGSYADVSTLAKVIPIYNGEPDSPDGSDYSIEYGLFPQEYAKASEILDGDSTVLVRINAPDNADTVAEYWFELTIGETTPSITFQDPSNENAVFRFNGQILRDAVNIWHIITTDGGNKFYCEIKNYSI